VHFVAYANLTQYTFDPMPRSNPTGLVCAPSLPQTGIPIPINSVWHLAALSMDASVDAELLRLPSDRATARFMLAVFDELRTGIENPTILLQQNAQYAAMLVPIMQMLSLIDFATDKCIAGQYYRAISGPLVRSGCVQVWAYSLSSRTAVVGLIVVAAGMLVVFVRFFLGLFDGREARHLTQIVVAALAYIPGEDSMNSSNDDIRAAQQKFTVLVDSSVPGRLRYSPP
jgi:hypothetical protein